MPVDVTWYFLDMIMICRFRGEVTLEEIEHASQQIASMIDDNIGEHKVHILYDGTLAEGFPNNIHNMAQAARPALGHPRAGMLVAYRIKGAQVKFILNSIAQIFKTNHYIAFELPDALQFMTHHDEYLDDIPIWDMDKLFGDADTDN